MKISEVLNWKWLKLKQDFVIFGKRRSKKKKKKIMDFQKTDFNQFSEFLLKVVQEELWIERTAR